MLLFVINSSIYSLRYCAQNSNVEMSFKDFAFEAEQNPTVEALSLTDTRRLKPNLSMHIVALEFTDQTVRTTTQKEDSYHCLVMSNIMMTPLQFLYTSRNSASRATSSDCNTYIHIKLMYSLHDNGKKHKIWELSFIIYSLEDLFGQFHYWPTY